MCNARFYFWLVLLLPCIGAVGCQPEKQAPQERVAHEDVAPGADPQAGPERDGAAERLPPGAVAQLPKASERIVALHYSANGQTLRSLTAGRSGLVSDEWDVATGKQRREIPLKATVGKSIRTSADGNVVAVVDAEGRFQVWSVPANKLLWEAQRPLLLPERERTSSRKSDTFKGPPPRGDAMLEFSADGKAIAGLTDGRDLSGAWIDAGQITVWEAATGKQLHVANTEVMRSVALGPSGKPWILAVGTQRHVVLMDLITGKVHRELDIPERPKLGPETYVQSVVAQMVFASDGKQIAVVERIATSLFEGADRHREIRLWELSDPPRQRLISRPAATAPVFSGDGSTMAFGLEFAKRRPGFKGGGYWDAGVAVWDTRQGKFGTRKLEIPFPYHTAVEHLVFAPDGRRLATSGPDGRILIWDVAELLRHPLDGPDKQPKKAR